MFATVKTLPADGPVPCPRRGCAGSIVEQDVAVRWNPITVRRGRPVADTGGDYQFGAHGRHPFVCDTCLGPVHMPAGYDPPYT